MDELIDTYALSFDKLHMTITEVLNFIKARVDKMGRTPKISKTLFLLVQTSLSWLVLEAAGSSSEAAKTDGYKAVVESLSCLLTWQKADASVANMPLENDQEKPLLKQELTG